MNNNVILFTQDGCPQCRMVHILLDKKHISYTENKDIEAMKALGIAHTPALSVDGKILQGKEIFNYINGAK